MRRSIMPISEGNLEDQADGGGSGSSDVVALETRILVPVSSIRRS